MTCNELVVCAHLDVAGVVVDFAADVVASLHVVVILDLNLGIGEVVKGDPLLESVFEWFSRSGLACCEGGFDFFIAEAVQPLVKLLSRHCGCR